ncbi:right-handed parallel beta-helix repeat-containing protein [Catenulispora sp. NF23]|uniref:right-handed parallel beta-helix repeat-containing protein n=1 Tax=Catenulispora pinistramenti TaxID=2705254 RepID=UPI001BAAECA2|nr:right-handed parallel beta-helix repeat-containing protein [Catenulispora pinistramenti]MBS2536873.1 right-handed parallel beta-helix repeat-containing protein [Catenulispora pinistramenti]
MITIAAGVYQEDLILDRDVTLVADGAVELSPLDGPAIHVRSGQATVHGLTVREPRPDHAAVVVSGGRLVLRDCDVIGGGVRVGDSAVVELAGGRVQGCVGPAVAARGDATVRLAGCVLRDIDGSAIAVSQTATVEATGVVVLRATGAAADVTGGAMILTDCELAESGAGILADGRAVVKVHDSRLRDLSTDAVHTAGEATVELTGTVISRCGGAGVTGNAAGTIVLDDCRIEAVGSSGAAAQGTAKLNVTGCSITHPGGFGVYAAESASVDIVDSEIRDCARTAVHFAGTVHAWIHGGKIVGTPEHGIRLTGSAILRLDGGTAVEAAGMTGLQIEGEADATVRGLIVEGANIGIRVQDTPHHPLFEACEVRRTVLAGIEAAAETSPTFRACVVEPGSSWETGPRP